VAAVIGQPARAVQHCRRLLRTAAAASPAASTWHHHHAAEIGAKRTLGSTAAASPQKALDV